MEYMEQTTNAEAAHPVLPAELLCVCIGAVAGSLWIQTHSAVAARKM